MNTCFWKKITRTTGLAALVIVLPLALSSCQPLYSSPQGTVGVSNNALSDISVADVSTREAQQVRNHLIFLLNGGATPASNTHEVRLRVTSTTKTLATGIREANGPSVGNTTGSVEMSVSYEIYEIAGKTVTHRGRRVARASYDKTNQSFANIRAERDAQNRAARAVAEQLRFAIASDLAG